MKPPKSRQHNPQRRPTLRLIGGQWRGRKLPIAEVEGLRPTGDRIRETLFNWLAPQLPGARCLDVYAGSGALGLECLSRGAGTTLMIERERRAAGQLRENLNLLGADHARLVQSEALAHLRAGNPDAPYELVFVDPPFAADLWQDTLAALEEGNWLSGNAAIYVESGREPAYAPPPGWQLHREKQAGQVCYRLYHRRGL